MFCVLALSLKYIPYLEGITTWNNTFCSFYFKLTRYILSMIRLISFVILLGIVFMNETISHFYMQPATIINDQWNLEHTWGCVIICCLEWTITWIVCWKFGASWNFRTQVQPDPKLHHLLWVPFSDRWILIIKMFQITYICSSLYILYFICQLNA